ncbi:MAG: hypothetical protein UY48_C0008G0019 [Candidatus Gottesmanbacteria bacterium GW2011_GWB1_49_7]|uniref:Uncharacterized protein n=1 Tax=Candidatus Gottesmanbacteria bacterium GW2011_GWB1_49_7 TaxID=1618448 RepID=A0A0G1Z269_9BACT|nr:MAG: hypothetical protein UY48_C0008G0019 [Candidatus Gottesmanbacteria bacterium GW2011_GWB1_49_7]
MKDYFIRWLKANEYNFSWTTRTSVDAFNWLSHKTNLTLRIHYRDKDDKETTRCLRGPKIVIRGGKTVPAWRLLGQDDLRDKEWRMFIPSTIITGW